MASDSLVDVSADIPIACSLTPGELRTRAKENASLFARADGVQELPDGYRFAFPADVDTARSLLQFVLAERACCPFFTFELTFPSPHQVIHLTVRGREGVKEIVRWSVASTIIERASAETTAELSRVRRLQVRSLRAGGTRVLVHLCRWHGLLWLLCLPMARWYAALRRHQEDVDHSSQSLANR